MKLFCPECRSTFDDSETVCPNDGTRLYRLDPADDPLVGATLDDRYRIDWLIGEGGMGAVYRGIQLSVNREVAIKVLRAELSDREIALERFFREAKLVSELSHPNIVRVVDFGQDHERDLLFLVMEMVRGVSLGDLLERGRLRVNFALELAYQVCGALTEPHAAGIVHRDLKPDNLLLVPVSDGTIQVKVLDFGIARALERNTRLTATGMICGTPAYMAPEQSRNQELDARTDLYALGVLLYEMLAGLPPFSGQSSLQIMLKHIQEEPQRLREILPPSALPEQVEGLVHDMMSKDRDARPQSAHDVRERIEELRSGFELDAVRVDSDLERDEMFEEWLLPSLPTAKEATRSETQALRRETGLFDHLDEDSDEEISEAATIGMDEGDKPRSEELDVVNLNDTEVDHLGPTTPSEIPVFEGKVRHAATSPGPASAWTPGPRHLVPVQEDDDEKPAMLSAGPQPSRSPTSEVSSADEASVDQQSRSPGNARPNTDKRSAVEGESGGVSTTATVLMSVAGSAVIMALFAVAGILYFESTAQPDTSSEASPEAVETREEATRAEDKTPLGDIETSSTLSSATPDPEGGEATESNEETEDDVAMDNDDAPRGSPTKPTVTEKPERVKDDGRTDAPAGEEAGEDDSGDKTRPASADGEETQPSKATPGEPEADRSETEEEASAATSSETKNSDDTEDVDDELEHIFESGSLRAE